MAYTTTPAPGKGQTHHAIITIVGPKDPTEFMKFKVALKELVAGIGGSIGLRGTVDTTTGTFIYPPGQEPKK